MITRGRSVTPVLTPLPPPLTADQKQQRAGLVMEPGPGATLAWAEAEGRREAIERSLEGARAALAALDGEIEQARRAHRAADAEAVIAGEASPSREAVAALEARRVMLAERVRGIEEKQAEFRAKWLESALREIDRQDAHDAREMAETQARADVIQAEITAHQARRNAELATLDQAARRKGARQPRRQELTRELGEIRRAATT